MSGMDKTQNPLEKKAKSGNQGSCFALTQPPMKRFHPNKPLKSQQPLYRFPAIRPAADEVFDEYLSHPSVNHSYHMKGLSQSYGLLEFHYDTMRKVALQRANMGVTTLPEKPVGAIPGYSGFIPRKGAMNVIGTTYAQGNVTANTLHETLRKETGFRRTHSTPSMRQYGGAPVANDTGF
jgi:hypothetical protein